MPNTLKCQKIRNCFRNMNLKNSSSNISEQNVVILSNMWFNLNFSNVTISCSYGQMAKKMTGNYCRNAVTGSTQPSDDQSPYAGSSLYLSSKGLYSCYHDSQCLT